MNLDLGLIIKELVTLVGKHEARRLMVLEGISPHTADKMIGDRYPSKIGHLLGAAIQRALKVAKQKAS